MHMVRPNETASFEDLKLSDFLCFAVYSANLAFGRAYQATLEKMGLTYTQYIAIIALWEEDNQSVQSLGKKLFLESNTMTPMLKKLEAMGLLERRRDSANERLVRVTLTKKGRDLRATRPERCLSDAMGLEPAEFKQIQKAVVRLRGNLIKSRKVG
jgi:MarR family transcriptional regulator, organic hydroperoxide resistance regulator